jgi:outer membrane protein OmpA-like peptidoglycan-associated protein
MRRLAPSLLTVALLAPAGTLAAQSLAPTSDGSLAGAHEVALFITGRVLPTSYSVADGRSAMGGQVAGATHFGRFTALQAALGVAYSRQDMTYYKPPLFVFTPTLSFILQGATNKEFQPYALVGGGYEFVRFTRPRCDCDQSRSFGFGNVGAGVRRMIGDRRAFRIELSSQIAAGGPAFTIGMGVSLFSGGSPRIMKSQPRPPERIRTEPPVTPPQRIPVQTTPIQTTPVPTAPTPAPAPAPTTPPAQNLAGTVLLTIDGTQVDFNKPAWRDDAEPLLDGLAVDLTSDAGEKIKINIEAHTDNIGSKSGNIAIGLDRAKAVREFLINQGISADRIAISSAGGDVPIAPNNTALGRQRNRRIVIRRTN